MSDFEQPPELQTPATVLAQAFKDAGLGMDPLTANQVISWPIYISHEPLEPEELMAVYDTEPEPIAQLLNGETLRNWGVTLILRTGADGYTRGWHRLMGVARWCEETCRFKKVAFHDSKFIVQQIRISSGPMFAGREDENRRCLFSLNLLARIVKG